MKALRQSFGYRPSHRHSRRRKSSSKSFGSSSAIDRIVRYKRNALIGICFGVPGIIASIALAVFRWGIFAEHANEVALAIFVFIGAYGAVVTGCYWWLKAKAWHEAVLFIAFMPLTVFFVPYVRILVIRVAPQLLIAAMIMMPLILVVVVAVLPDKSGMSSRRASWEQRRD